MDMLLRYLVAMLIIAIVLASWIMVQHLSRRFAATHPEFGPAREEGGGCGSGGKCHCGSSKTCSKNTRLKKMKNS